MVFAVSASSRAAILRQGVAHGSANVPYVGLGYGPAGHRVSRSLFRLSPLPNRRCQRRVLKHCQFTLPWPVLEQCSSERIHIGNLPNPLV